MSDQTRIESLIRKHKDLDNEIKLCYSRYIDDPMLIKMKKEKLHIKEQIEKLKKDQANET